MAPVFINTDPSESDAELLKKLREVEALGESLIVSDEIFNRQKSLKEDIVYKMTFPVHNYISSIEVLLSQGRTHAAWVLLRSVFEAWITVIHILECDDDRNADIFRLTSDQEHVVQLIKLKKITEKHPELERVGMSIEKMDEVIAVIAPQVEAVKSKYNPPLPNKITIAQKAEQIDIYRREKLRFEPTHSAYFQYLTTYGHLSQPAHLSPLGLLGFFDMDGEESYKIYLSGRPEDIATIANLSRAFYLEFLDWFCQDFIPDQLKKIRAIR